MRLTSDEYENMAVARAVGREGWAIVNANLAVAAAIQELNSAITALAQEFRNQAAKDKPPQTFGGDG